MTWASAEADASARRAHARRGVAGGVRLRDIAFFVEPTLGAAAHQHAVAVVDGYGNRDAGGFALARADRVHTVAVSWPPVRVVPRGTIGYPGALLRSEPREHAGRGACRCAARIHRWRSVTVVVGTTQVLRARVRLERGLSAHLALSGVDPAGFFSWSSGIAYDQARS